MGVQIFYQDAHIFGGDIVELDGNLILRAAIGDELGCSGDGAGYDQRRAGMTELWNPGKIDFEFQAIPVLLRLIRLPKGRDMGPSGLPATLSR